MPTQPAQHTPGPWTIDEDDYGVFFIAATPNHIAECRTSEGSSEANARLISAAPDLLAALLAMSESVAEIESIWGSGDLAAAVRQLMECSEDARAAISKAKGGAR